MEPIRHERHRARRRRACRRLGGEILRNFIKSMPAGCAVAYVQALLRADVTRKDGNGNTILAGAAQMLSAAVTDPRAKAIVARRAEVAAAA
jgi:hypothetical protein